MPTLRVQPGTFAVCRLAPDAAIPAWAGGPGGFSSITRTKDELSIICEESAAPFDVHTERGWALFKVDGPLDFGVVGILASIAQPLAAAGVSLLAVGTFDTDYLLVKRTQLAAAIETLRAAGRDVRSA